MMDPQYLDCWVEDDNGDGFGDTLCFDCWIVDDVVEVLWGMITVDAM